MAEEKPPPGELRFRDDAAAGEQTEAQPRISVMAQYTKDLSFENPNAPDSVIHEGDEPHGELTVQVRSRALGGEHYEVSLEFQVEAKRDGELVFLIELNYAGMFVVSGLDETNRRAIIMIECPRILYPFARRIIADTVRDGGFPQLMLGPIDFYQLYLRHSASEGKAESPEAAEA